MSGLQAIYWNVNEEGSVFSHIGKLTFFMWKFSEQIIVLSEYHTSLCSQ